MIEVFPREIKKERVQASLDRLVSAFLLVAEDLAKEQECSTQESADSYADHRRLAVPPAFPLVANNKMP